MMKLATVAYHDQEYAGILEKETLFPFKMLGFACDGMQDFLQKGGMDCLDGLYALCASQMGIPLVETKLLAPIPEPGQDVLCLGLNYYGHAEESARFHADSLAVGQGYPVYFSKRVNRATADGDAIDGHLDIVDALDYETELAVVIGKDAKNVSESDAYSYILGYTIINDVSARNLQTRHGQWYFGKSLDGFTPMGPWIVTKDAFSWPPALNIQTRVNGEVRQQCNTGKLIYGIAKVIAELSSGMTLKAGTILATGTPEGVGMGMTPPAFLKKGDLVECEIQGIGVLHNFIR